MLEKLHLAPVLYSTLVYLFVIIGFRLLGKKELGKLTITDFIFIMLVSEALGPAMVGADNSLAGGLIAGATLMLVNKLFEYLIYKSDKVKELMEGNPSILIRNGKINQKELKRNQIKIEELEQMARAKGKGDLSSISIAILETDGQISILDNTDFKASGKMDE